VRPIGDDNGVDYDDNRDDRRDGDFLAHFPLTPVFGAKQMTPPRGEGLYLAGPGAHRNRRRIVMAGTL
jgi:hypothetical protein